MILAVVLTALSAALASALRLCSTLKFIRKFTHKLHPLVVLLAYIAAAFTILALLAAERTTRNMTYPPIQTARIEDALWAMLVLAALNLYAMQI